MPQVYACTLSIRDDGADLAPRFLKVLRAWVGRRWPSDQGWFEAETPRSVGLEDDSILRWEPWKDETESLHEFTWRHPHVDGSGITWATQASLVRTPEGTRLSLRVWNTGPEVGEPGFLPTTRPRLVLEMADTFDCRLPSGARLTLEPRILDPAEILTFVRYELLDPAREVPILLATMSEDRESEVPMPQLASEFAGLCEVVAIVHPNATFDLTHELGRRLSCFGGAIRVYRAPMARSDDPFRHPLLLPRRVRDRDDRLRLANSLALVMARSFQGDPAIPLLRDRRALEFERRRERLLAALEESHETTTVEVWRELAEEQERQNLQLRTEIDRTRQDNEELRQRVRWLQYALEARDQADGQEAGHEELNLERTEPSTVFEAIEYADTFFADELLVLPSAFEAARDSPFRRPSDLFAALEAMATIEEQQRRGPLGKNLREAFAELGQDYRGGISKTSSKAIRMQHVFSADGDEYVCEEHLCFGSTYDPAACARIYFTSKHPDEPRFVVGHVGRHLDAVSTT